MQSLADIPRVLQKIQDLRKFSSSQVVLNQYKKNFKLFVQALTKEVLQMIDKYQFTIKQLTQQNKNLKQAKQSGGTSPIRKISHSPSPKTKSPSKEYKNIDMIQTTKSNVFGSNYLNNIQGGALFSTVLAKYKKSDDEDNNFPIELISGQNGQSVDEDNNRKSRFMAQTNIKKQKEEDLRCYLEAGSKNLQKTTKMLISAFGREEDQEFQLEQLNKNNNKYQNSDSSLQVKKIDSSLNKSLGNICQSMDSSFHSRKARSKNAKRRSQIQQAIMKKQKQDEEASKMLRERGVKNLLHKLRDNAQNTTKPSELIKSQKLISCGKKSNKPKKISRQNSPTLSSKKNSKVFINPVPVDITQKSKATRQESSSSPISPQKKPQSILKHSSVLSKSLLGISAIQFE